MSPNVRRGLFIASALFLAALFLWGVQGLPAFGAFDGNYGRFLNDVAVSQRHATNVVTAVVFDYRALDTLGEEFVLLAAVAGVSLLLRELPGEEKEEAKEETPGRSVPETSDAVRVFGVGQVVFITFFGLYVILHGHLTAGGGFQGGMVIASAFLLIYLATDYETFYRLSPMNWIEFAEALGAGSFVGIGLLALFSGAAFLQNVLPLGQIGNFLAAGTIPVLNIAIGLAVASSTILILRDFLEQTLLLREGRTMR